ncbi:2-oxoacid dehydrogenases acyltransferase-domain-containing protein [Pseudomassariella vexata]|uniref:Dihydrolipoamide acetyltransferase component of pyruvate dehydrogenase complex n=1 Tax=Pseudomassariella vexata TaxID=1141098 RepID=A0A1Y2E4A9_9PEZI|nr:2-oxoacid dehydrogenases acyltransferase-domain-containing protein [Pseudomassariella vexata]ORY66362.1 2-oxoacid dehydrogenases acyltransferase-domain-containing protein [Pseudomassariella vexata]
MFLQRGSRAIRRQWHLYHTLNRFVEVGIRRGAYATAARGFHSTTSLQVVKPVLLADIGEGIVECEIIQWFVEPEARVEEFSPLCEVQSDKASVEITSRFSGIVKKLHYDAGEMAKVGKPFVDIDIQGDVKKEDLEALTVTEPEAPVEIGVAEPLNKESLSKAPESQVQEETSGNEIPENNRHSKPPKQGGRFASLATPAVRHLSKAYKVDITEIEGTGRDGRVLKEDIHRFVENRNSSSISNQAGTAPPSSAFSQPVDTATQTETTVQLTHTQAQMFRTMTRSLSIPHFLYADEIDFTNVCSLRRRLNKILASSAKVEEVTKLTYLPFIIKAVSVALNQYPVLNSRVDVDSQTSKPSLMMRSQHNIGVAMDTPSGLVVPVIKNVGSRNILSIAAELVRLQSLAATSRLSVQDMSGGTITVSNIGNIGGTYLSPVLVDKEVAILGIGRIRTVPAFDEDGNVVKKHVCNFSWSADHRVVDGATMARAAEVVRQFVEQPEVMVTHLR